MKLTLNIGCGDRTFKEYPKGYKCINVDERNLKSVDTVMDVRNLKFPDNHFDYILASDIIEHFPLSKIDNILKEWTRVLKAAGIIEFRMPNLKTICKNYISGSADAKLTSWLLYGAQDYPGNFHYVGFDRPLFKSVIKKHRLTEIEYREAGNNFEMKVRYRS